MAIVLNKLTIMHDTERYPELYSVLLTPELHVTAVGQLSRGYPFQYTFPVRIAPVLREGITIQLWRYEPQILVNQFKFTQEEAKRFTHGRAISGCGGWVLKIYTTQINEAKINGGMKGQSGHISDFHSPSHRQEIVTGKNAYRQIDTSKAPRKESYYGLGGEDKDPCMNFGGLPQSQQLDSPLLKHVKSTSHISMTNRYYGLKDIKAIELQKSNVNTEDTFENSHNQKKRMMERSTGLKVDRWESSLFVDEFMTSGKDLREGERRRMIKMPRKEHAEQHKSKREHN